MLRRAALCLSLFTLTACSGAPQATPANATEPRTATAAPSAATAATAPSDAGASDAYANKPYAQARAALIADGWLPVRTPACRTNVGGDAAVCNTLPETDSCSGDGHCLMRFAQPASSQVLTLHAYGDAARWNDPQGDFVVMSVERATAPAARVAACPAKDVEAFVRAFASTPATRAAFTAPVVRASELQSGEDGDRLVPVAYLGSTYAGFNLTHDGRAFHHVAADGKVDPSPLAVDVQPDGDGTTVRYAYGSSEGRAFRFERAGDCWRLVEQLPPALD